MTVAKRKKDLAAGFTGRLPKPSPVQVSESKASSFESGDEGGEPMITTTFKIARRHHDALRQAALEDAGSKRADQSKLLRHILDAWLKNRA